MKTPGAIELPREMRSFFSETGYLEPVNQRAHDRLQVRREATITLPSIPPQLREKMSAYLLEREILVKDMAIGGICILYHLQLFPSQVFHVDFHGRKIKATVVRCRRLGGLCCEIAGRIDEVEPLCT